MVHYLLSGLVRVDGVVELDVGRVRLSLQLVGVALGRRQLHRQTILKPFLVSHIFRKGSP